MYDSSPRVRTSWKLVDGGGRIWEKVERRSGVFGASNLSPVEIKFGGTGRELGEF